MKILVAGATGVIGRSLVPRLVEAGHDVVGTTRSEDKRELLTRLGARPLVLDALDPEGVREAVSELRPDAVVHQLTALSEPIDMRRFDRSFAVTNRLRTEGTEILLSAAREAEAERFVAQSFAGWPYAREGGAVKSEEDPLDPEPIPAMRETLAAIRYLEDAVTGADWTTGIVLRYGSLYGPGTFLGTDPEGDLVRTVRQRKLPVLGGGEGVWSFVHVEDAASATVAAIEGGRRGIYNVVDDEPAPVREWLPVLADALGAKPPLRIPKWLGRIVAGRVAAVMMTEVRGASNRKAKRELGWEPRYGSWREGFVRGLG